MREEYYTDDQGRRVRVNHAARLMTGEKQQTFWDDIRSASRTHMHVSLQQRRDQIVGDCKQLKTDMDSYNENENTGEPIQMVFDFTQETWKKPKPPPSGALPTAPAPPSSRYPSGVFC